jgi:hypothetical protein
MDQSSLCRFEMRCLGSVQFTFRKKYLVYDHFCSLTGGLSNRLRPDSDVIGIETEDALGEEVSRVRLTITRGTFVSFPAWSVTVAADWLKIPILPSLIARRAAKCFSTSIFLIRAMAAPAVPYKSSAAFIKSAEEIRLRYCRLPVVAFTGLPMASPDTTSSTLRFSCRPAELSFEATGELLPKPVALTVVATTPCCTR